MVSFQSDKSSSPLKETRVVRVFVSSTFRDMIAERDKLMAHTWPQLRKLCRERQVELVEVDLRWGIAEEQSTRKETLKLCLDEIRACRPYFIGLLGERYGWVPGDEAFTADLREEQPWLRDLQGKSVTELEILHGVLNNPEIAGRAFFYLRDPLYLKTLPPGELANFAPESEESAAKQKALKTLVRSTCSAKQIPLRENYTDPEALAALVLEDLGAAIKAEFPEEEIPDSLTSEARSHEAFAETRRRTYIGRSDYFDILDRHATADGGPLMLLGESGSGKSALLANWLAHWRIVNPQDFIIQHYIGSSADSADHWRLMSRVMAEIKKWTGDQEDPPTDRDEIKRDFPLWLVKGRLFAQQKGVRFILVIDALNQLADQDRARLLAWLPIHPFSGPLHFFVSTLPGQPGLDDPLQAARARGWQELQIQPLSEEERHRMITNYLSRFGKKLDQDRLERLAAAAPAANPLYLKILLDELRVTGTHERLDERLSEYLAAADIPALLQQVLARYQRDYERDRPGLVAETLSLLWAARRGLTENELLALLKPVGQAQLPPATWAPFRASLEEFLVDRGVVLDFTHNFFRSAVEGSFIAGQEKCAALRRQLAAFFEGHPLSSRSCDELPWLYEQTGSLDHLRACLLSIDRFLLIKSRDEEELRRYWVKSLREEQAMGKAYIESFKQWADDPDREDESISYAAYGLATFLHSAALYLEGELLLRQALAINEVNYGSDHPIVASCLSILALLLADNNNYAEAELLSRRALQICENSFGANHSDVAMNLNNLALFLYATNRHNEAEPLLRRALQINESIFGTDHPNVALILNSLAENLRSTHHYDEAEPLLRRALQINESIFGTDHPNVAFIINNIAELLKDTNRHNEAEPLLRRALQINESIFGTDHPNVARALNNLAGLLKTTNRYAEAEPLYRKALTIDEASFGPDNPYVAYILNGLAGLLVATKRYSEAEPLIRRALAIVETSFGPDNPEVARNLNDFAVLLRATKRHAEAEPLIHRALTIVEASFGPDNPAVAFSMNNMAGLLAETNRHAEAEPLIHRALTIIETNYASNHPRVATYASNLYKLLVETNRYAEAEPLIRRVLSIVEVSFGLDHSEVATALTHLGKLLYTKGKYSEAEKLFRRALQIDETNFGLIHPRVADNLNSLAVLCTETNNHLEAVSLYRRVVEILLDITRSTGHIHPDLKIGINNYGGSLQTIGKEDKEILRILMKLSNSYGFNLRSFSSCSK